jgi:hypothetical protein
MQTLLEKRLSCQTGGIKKKNLNSSKIVEKGTHREEEKKRCQK